MAKKEASAGAPASVVVSEPLSLNEFCIRLSQKDARVELIGGFEYVERQVGHLKDTAENFTVRFEQFINQPA